MTLQERADAYARKFPQWPASHLHVGQEQGHDVIYGIWVIGNDYQNPTDFYGAYPKSYMERVLALFPDVTAYMGVSAAPPLLHAFSGSLPESKNYHRCDMEQDAEFECNVVDLPEQTRNKYDLVMADPPYSAVDALHYGTPGVNRGLSTRALAEVTSFGGHMVWLDTCWPMHTKTQWITVGRIFIQRSTNHRVRLCSIFERVR